MLYLVIVVGVLLYVAAGSLTFGVVSAHFLKSCDECRRRGPVNCDSHFFLVLASGPFWPAVVPACVILFIANTCYSFGKGLVK